MSIRHSCSDFHFGVNLWPMNQFILPSVIFLGFYNIYPMNMHFLSLGQFTALLIAIFSHYRNVVLLLTQYH